MPKSTTTIAEELGEQMRKQGVAALTFPWPAFYEAVGRDRIKQAFQEQLTASLAAHSLLVVFGRATVVVCQDFNFSPVKY